MIWKSYPWPLGQLGCQVMVIFSEAAAFVSVFTMFAFTFERFTAVCYPLRPSLHSTVKRTRIIIVAIWILALIPSSVWTRYINMHFLLFGEVQTPILEAGVCGIARNQIDASAVVLAISTTFFLFIIPSIVFPFIYYK